MLIVISLLSLQFNASGSVAYQTQMAPLNEKTNVLKMIVSAHYIVLLTTVLDEIVVHLLVRLPFWKKTPRYDVHVHYSHAFLHVTPSCNQ